MEHVRARKSSQVGHQENANKNPAKTLDSKQELLCLSVIEPHLWSLMPLIGLTLLLIVFKTDRF